MMLAGPAGQTVLLRWCVPAGLVALLVLAAGCAGQKSDLEGKVKVQASPELTDLGVTVTDWRYVDKKFGVKLTATKELGPPWLITVQPGKGAVYMTMSPVRLKAGETAWVDFATFKFLHDPVELTEATGTVTVSVHDQRRAP
jgi:hypothetical protein